MMALQPRYPPPFPDTNCFPDPASSAFITVTRGATVLPPLYTSPITVSLLWGPPLLSKLVWTCMLFMFCWAELCEVWELSRLRQGVEVTEEADLWLAPRVLTPSSRGPPAAMVLEVELCLEVTRLTPPLPPPPGPTARAGGWPGGCSFSQCSTTVIFPLLSMIFQDGISSCRPSAAKVSHTILGMVETTEREEG